MPDWRWSSARQRGRCGYDPRVDRSHCNSRRCRGHRAWFAGKRAAWRGAWLSFAGTASLALAAWVWFGIGAEGSMKFVERADWVPSLGIEYHLGVDGLGALMVLLAAIVSLMAIAASTKVASQPGLYFALILLLESGLFGTFTALNFFHWFPVLGTQPDTGLLLIKLWGGEGRGPAATQVLRLHHWSAPSRCCSLSWRCFSPPAAWISRCLPGWPRPANWPPAIQALSRADCALACARRASRLCGESPADAVPHLASPQHTQKPRRR